MTATNVSGLPGNFLSICLVTSVYPPVIDGFSTYMRDLAVTLAKLRQSVTVLWVDFETIPPGQVHDCSEAGVRVVHVNPTLGVIARSLCCVTRLAQLGRSYEIWRLIRKYHAETPFDVIEFSNWHAPGALHSLFKVTSQVVRVTTSIGQLDLRGSASGRLTRPDRRELRAAKIIAHLEAFSIRRSDLIIAPTSGHWRAITERISVGRANERIRIIPFGIDLSGRDDTQWRSCGEASCRILFVGRLSHRKGFDIFMAAIPDIVRNSVTDVSITVIGDDVKDAEGCSTWQTLSSRLDQDVMGRIKYLGRVSDEEREENYRHCDLFVAPSRYESFGLMYIEAMSYGVPVVGARVGGVPEVVDDGVTGLLVDSGDAAGLASAVVQMANDPERRRAIGFAARQRVVQEFSCERMAQRTLEGYHSVSPRT